jgi:hypothetical protein
MPHYRMQNDSLPPVTSTLWHFSICLACWQLGTHGIPNFALFITYKGHRAARNETDLAE